MPRKRTRTRRRHRGEGPVLDKIKKVAEKVHDFVKKHRLVSKGLAAVSPFAGPLAPLTTGASAGAAALGYGHRRRRYRKKRHY